jgi:hypothetical protein
MDTRANYTISIIDDPQVSLAVSEKALLVCPREKTDTLRH